MSSGKLQLNAMQVMAKLADKNNAAAINDIRNTYVDGMLHHRLVRDLILYFEMVDFVPTEHIITILQKYSITFVEYTAKITDNNVNPPDEINIDISDKKMPIKQNAKGRGETAYVIDNEQLLAITFLITLTALCSDKQINMPEFINVANDLFRNQTIMSILTKIGYGYLNIIKKDVFSYAFNLGVL
jgi:hypothetical protein